MSLESLPIGPNRCFSCGEEYGEHTKDCKTRRVIPEEVSFLDLIEQIQELKYEQSRLKERIRELETNIPRRIG
jgi:DNA-directed RNA polymerase subunit N (RpoN/RPB10)